MNKLNYLYDIRKLYAKRIKTQHVDPKTGVNSDRTKRFACYPFIGSKYGEIEKIMFIGMDIGKDETNRIIDLSERNNQIEHTNIEYFNPHIAGTYFLALYFQCINNKDIKVYWNAIKKLNMTCKEILKNKRDLLPNPEIYNPLSYVSLTNYYKYVTIGRANRSGNLDRVDNHSFDFIQEEVKILKPDYILFQSKSFHNLEIARLIRGKGTRIFVGSHPAARSKGIRVPSELIESYNEIT